MKNIFISAFVLFVFTLHSFGQVKLDQNSGDNYFQVGYEVYTPLTIGYENAAPLNSPWAIEHWDGGLNFWKPFPSYNNGNYKFFINDDGLVGIGKKPDTGDKLQVNGNIRTGANIYGASGNFSTVNATGISDMNVVDINVLFNNGSFVFSDEKLKTNIEEIKDPLQLLLKLHGKSYTKKHDFLKDKSAQMNSKSSKRKSNNGNKYGLIKQETINSDKAREDTSSNAAIAETYDTEYNENEMGLIAQEVQKIFPDLVKEDHNGVLGVNYVGLIPVMIEALREQNEKIEVLEALSKGNSKSKRITSPNFSNPSQNGNPVEDFSVGAVLHQNDPNPFNQSTIVRYEIPDGATIAYLFIYDLNGTQKRSFELNQRGNGSLTIEASEFVPGMYLYTLVVDEKEIDTKRMIITD